MAVLRAVSKSTDSPHDISNNSVGWLSSDPWLQFIVFGIILIVPISLMLLAALSNRCAETWRWLKAVIVGSADISMSPMKRPTAVISHSLPDLQACLAKTERVQERENKKVLRQTTLPIASGRPYFFGRQMSQPSIQFSICRLEDKGDSDLGVIKPELYHKEAELMRLKDLSPSVDYQYAGKLHFALRYDPDIEGLMVKVLEARDLQIKDSTSHADPYIKIHLLPDKKKKFRTKVRRKNQNPVFNETFIFSVSYDDLQNRHLQFSVYDSDRFSKHDLIGQVVLKGLLDTTDLLQEIEYTMDILCPPQEKKGLGELMLSLCYLPTAGRLTLTVIKARNLKAMDINGKSDPYVKMYLLSHGKRIKKKKTTIKKSTLSPVYDEAFVFDIPLANIDDVCLVLKVLDHDRIGSNDFIGCIGIGSKFVGVGRSHWMEMLENPRKPVRMWHPLLENLPENIELDLESSKMNLNCLHSR